MDPIVTRVSGRPLAAGAPRRVRDRSPPEGVAIEPGLALRVQWSQELSRMGMRWRSTRPGRPACQIVCRRPTPQLGQRPSPMTAAGGTAGDEANEAVSTDTRRAKPRPSGCRYPSGTAMPTWPPAKESSLISMLDEDCWLRKIHSISDVPLSISFRSRSRQPHPADGDAARHHEGCGSHGSGSVRDRSLQRQRRG